MNSCRLKPSRGASEPVHTLLIKWKRSPQELVRKIGRTAIRLGRKNVATTMYQGCTEISPGTTTHVWTIGGGWIARVRLTFDAPSKSIYLSVQSVDAETEKQVLASFAERLEVVPVAEALRDVEQNGDCDPRSYVRLALASGGEPLEAVRFVIAGSLGSDRPNRRRGAALAIGLLLWPQFLSDVGAALKVEADEANRALLMVAYRQLLADASAKS